METIYTQTPNFLGSEVGLVLKTITVSASHPKAVEQNGRKIVKAGTVFTTPYYGLLYRDIDITDGAVEAPLMIGGRYIKSALPESVGGNEMNFQNQGLYPIDYTEAIRPNFGTAGLTKLGKVTASSSVAKTITITPVENAVGYKIYDANKKLVARIGKEQSYKTDAAGEFYVQAVGDHIYYGDGDLSEKVTVAGE